LGFGPELKYVEAFQKMTPEKKGIPVTKCLVMGISGCPVIGISLVVS
jgi:hypothetical protein